MPTYLDVRNNYPDQVAPTRDYHALAANDVVYRQEPFQIQAGRLPVSFKAPIARPKTMKQVMPDLPLQRVTVNVRSSNQRPIEEGTGQQGSAWRVSDPGWHAQEQNAVAGLPSGSLPGMGMMGDAATATNSSLMRWLAIGVAVGVAAYALRKH